MTTIHHTEAATEAATEAISDQVITDAERTIALDEPRPEPIWRVVGGSVAAGLLAAIALTVGFF